MLVTSIDVGSRNFVISVHSDNESSSFNDYTIPFCEHVDFISSDAVVVIRKLITYLSKPELEIALKVDKVGVESQFKAKRLIEKVWSAVYTFFYLKQPLYGYELINVSPRLKFRIYKGPSLPYKKSKFKYQDKKNKLIAEVLHMMGDLPQFKKHKEWIERLEKKDDVVDSTAQGWVLLRR